MAEAVASHVGGRAPFASDRGIEGGLGLLVRVVCGGGGRLGVATVVVREGRRRGNGGKQGDAEQGAAHGGTSCREEA